MRPEVLRLVSGQAGIEGGLIAPTGGTTGPQRRRAGLSVLPVGKQWSAQVVRRGLRPDDYADGYAELAEIVRGFGFDLDDIDPAEITLSSVETSDGPGHMIVVTHRIDDQVPGEGPAPV